MLSNHPTIARLPFHAGWCPVNDWFHQELSICTCFLENGRNYGELWKLEVSESLQDFHVDCCPVNDRFHQGLSICTGFIENGRNHGELWKLEVSESLQDFHADWCPFNDTFHQKLSICTGFIDNVHNHGEYIFDTGNERVGGDFGTCTDKFPNGTKLWRAWRQADVHPILFLHPGLPGGRTRNS